MSEWASWEVGGEERRGYMHGRPGKQLLELRTSDISTPAVAKSQSGEVKVEPPLRSSSETVD